MSTREEVWDVLHSVIAEIVDRSGIPSEEVKAESLLSADFDLTSVDTIHMIISLEERLSCDLDMETLVMKDGVYLTDLSVGQLHGHICDQIGAA